MYRRLLASELNTPSVASLSLGSSGISDTTAYSAKPRQADTAHDRVSSSHAGTESQTPASSDGPSRYSHGSLAAEVVQGLPFNLPSQSAFSCIVTDDGTASVVSMQQQHLETPHAISKSSPSLGHAQASAASVASAASAAASRAVATARAIAGSNMSSGGHGVQSAHMSEARMAAPSVTDISDQDSMPVKTSRSRDTSLAVDIVRGLPLTSPSQSAMSFVATDDGTVSECPTQSEHSEISQQHPLPVSSPQADSASVASAASAAASRAGATARAVAGTQMSSGGLGFQSVHMSEAGMAAPSVTDISDQDSMPVRTSRSSCKSGSGYRSRAPTLFPLAECNVFCCN